MNHVPRGWGKAREGVCMKFVLVALAALALYIAPRGALADDPTARVTIDVASLARDLAHAPRALDDATLPASSMEITLPTPSGQWQRFNVYESSLLPRMLRGAYPELRAYAGQGIDNPSATIRLDIASNVLHAMVLSADGAVFIDPLPHAPGTPTEYRAAWKRDLKSPPREWACLVAGGSSKLRTRDVGAPDGPVTTRVYRIALGVSGEFTQYHGGAKAQGLAAAVTILNRVAGVTERDLGVTFQLAPNTDQLIFTNPNTDPYNNSSPLTMVAQHQQQCDTIIGTWNYEIGHVLATAGGGYGEIGSVCQAGKKAMGVSGFFPPVGDAFAIDYVAHELGHQLGANHSFNGVGQSCKNGRFASTAWEPGSGSTIMSYAGICGPGDNIQPHSDPQFHAGSIAEVKTYLSWAGLCGWTIPSGNNDPVITNMPAWGLTIPRATPFELKAQGYDPDGDPIAWAWEQMDLGPAIPASGIGSGDNGLSPIFRSRPPTNSPVWGFPSKNMVLWNASVMGDQWPQTTRTLKFRATARDNRSGGGGLASADTLVNVYAGTQPFKVIQPWPGAWAQGGTLVQWDPAGTTNWPIYTSHVHIRLSIDGGDTYPYTLAEWVSNADAQRWVSLPNVNASQARVRVEAANNIYFAVSGPFTVAGSGKACTADCDANQVLTIDDQICFQTYYAMQSLSADCDANATLDIDDFLCFQTLYAIGC